MSLFVFGYGYTAAALARHLGWPVIATARTPAQAAALEAQGIASVDPANASAMAESMQAVRAILVTAPPDSAGCPGLRALGPAIGAANTFPDWIGYLSTTGVYGGRDGRWVFERTSPLNAASVEGGRRVAAERDWRQAGRDASLTVCTFRLPGIYGPGRSTFDRLRKGKVQRVIKAGQVFSRETLLSRVWGYDYFGGARTVDVHIRRLRAKLGEEHANLIQTVRSVGYSFGQSRWSI